MGTQIQFVALRTTANDALKKKVAFIFGSFLGWQLLKYDFLDLSWRQTYNIR